MDALTVVALAGGLVLLVGGAEVLVRGAAHLAVAIGISPLVVGLTVVAFGTSAPEIFVGVGAAATGRDELTLGNVVGSNTFNTLAILGMSAVVTPLVVHHKLVRREVPIMIGASALVLVLALDGSIGRVEGGVLFAGIIAYTVWAVVVGRREERELVEEYRAEVAVGVRRHWGLDLAMIGAGLVLLAAGSRWLVDGAVDLAEHLGVSELVIGLTVVAAGTSLPEAATSIVAGLRGHRDLAVGNVVGSNLFNLLAVLGLSALVAPRGVGVPASALRFDLPVMLATAVACLPVFFTGLAIRRWEGALFVGYYVAYVGYLLLDAADHEVIEPFSWVMLAFVIPLTVVTLAVVAAREWRQGRGRTGVVG